MNTGKLFILSSPSGGGKSSLAQALVQTEPDVAVSVSHTTRAPRPGEQNGVHYYFVSRDEFETMVDEGRFIEYARVFGNYYGTSQQAVRQLLERGKNVLLDIDWQGMHNIKRQMPEAVSIFILPPSRQALVERLKSRGQDSDEVVANRMKQAVSEMQHYNEFDYVVVNDDFNTALEDLRAIIRDRPNEARKPEFDIELLLADK